MKIRVYGKNYAEQVRKYETFTLDTEQFPQLELEIEAITSAYELGNDASSSPMKGLMADLKQKMWEVNFNVEVEDDGSQTSIWDYIGPDGGDPKDEQTNQTAWLEFESVENI